MTLARDWGMKVVERPISLDEVIAAHRDGSLEEVFGTGTAAVISPVGELAVGPGPGDRLVIHDGVIGETAKRLLRRDHRHPVRHPSRHARLADRGLARSPFRRERERARAPADLAFTVPAKPVPVPGSPRRTVGGVESGLLASYETGTWAAHALG
jgi:hypothetical protein